nr:MAG TPA: hypothetical protein [Caudoviricetes sp.]
MHKATSGDCSSGVAFLRYILIFIANVDTKVFTK